MIELHVLRDEFGNVQVVNPNDAPNPKSIDEFIEAWLQQRFPDVFVFDRDWVYDGDWAEKVLNVVDRADEFLPEFIHAAAHLGRDEDDLRKRFYHEMSLIETSEETMAFESCFPVEKDDTQGELEL